MGIDTAGLDGNIGDTSGDLVLMKPLTSPNGGKACLVFENNIMMYKNTPSQASSEAFLGLVHQEHEGLLGEEPPLRAARC